ncbi:MAG TPA: ATP synthase F1 subunit delta [Puia sp.]|nr:ATP synthase F1 subunit delta [Puia sp.]
MLNPRLAARYAKSLLDLAVEQGNLDAVYKDMLFMKGICQNRDFVSLLKSPVITTEQKEKIVAAVTKQKVEPITSLFGKFLAKKRREEFLPEIITAFISQYKAYKGIYTVKLTTAVPVSEELKKTIVNKIKSNSAMKQIELITEVKESIIGGFILEVEDKLVDESIAYDLNTAKKLFESNDYIYKIR